MKTRSQWVVRCTGPWALALSLLAVAGCASNPLSDEAKLSRYLKANPKRPAAVREALSKAELCKGMLPVEVRMSWGTPDAIEPYMEDGARGEKWHYAERPETSRNGSRLFSYTVPIGRAVFRETPEGMLLTDWNIYGEEEKQRQETVRQEEARKLAPPAKPAAAPAKPRPKARTVNSLMDLPSWPQITISALMKSGKRQIAIIDGNLVEPGETVNGILIEEVTEVGVYLKFEGETVYMIVQKDAKSPPKSEADPATK